MSRLTRSWEHLKAGFQAEAAAVARLEALARRAEREGKPVLAKALSGLADEKAELAGKLLEALGRSQDWGPELETLAAEERYELEVLYPKMSGDLDGPLRELVESVRERHRDHLARLEGWASQLLEGRTDLPPA